MSSLVPVVIVILLILFNAFFVAAEFAIVGISRIEVDRAVREGKRWSGLVQWFVSDPKRQDRFIATAQLGITAASLGLGMYGEHELAEAIAGLLDGWGAERWIAAHTVASVAAITVLTYFHIVIGEMVPKGLALQRPARTALAVAPVMRGLQLAFYPIVVGLNGLGNGLLKLVGINRSEGGTEHYRSPEEIEYIVRESEAGGLLRKESAHVVAELLDFGNLNAAEVMVPRVQIVGLPVEVELDALREVLEESPFTRYPVYEGTIDNIIGMLHIRDVLRWAQSDEPRSRTSYREVPHVPLTATTNDILSSMRRTGVQMVVVMGEHGGTEGIVTLEDLFEEVVGDITDRPGEARQITKEREGGVRADGSVRIDEIGDALGVVLEHDDVDTVSGLVLALLGRPPLIGDAVVYDGVRFVVAEIRGHGVASCLARLVPDPEPDA